MKTVCIYHSVDLDGYMSAAIVKHWFNGRGVRQHLDRPNDSIDFIGYNYGDPIPDLSKYDKVIMCDISFPKEEMSKLWHNLDLELIWIDHHISAINDNRDLVWLHKGLQDTKFAACELTWKYFFPNKPMPEIVRLLGRYDCFGHKGTNEETKVLEFQYGARDALKGIDDCYAVLIMLSHEQLILKDTIYLEGVGIYKYLCSEAKEVYKRGFEIKFSNVVIDPDITGGEDHQPYSFICFNKERFNPINFGIDYHADGYDGAACFWYQDGKWAFSLYNDNGEVDCSVIAKQYGGGGHKGASGFVIDDINLIIK